MYACVSIPRQISGAIANKSSTTLALCVRSSRSRVAFCPLTSTRSLSPGLMPSRFLTDAGTAIWFFALTFTVGICLAVYQHLLSKPLA